MASGSDPLDRLHACGRDLRAERELCHIEADRAFRTESGKAFSTSTFVMQTIASVSTILLMVCTSPIWARVSIINVRGLGVLPESAVAMGFPSSFSSLSSDLTLQCSNVSQFHLRLA